MGKAKDTTDILVAGSLISPCLVASLEPSYRSVRLASLGARTTFGYSLEGSCNLRALQEMARLGSRSHPVD